MSDQGSTGKATFDKGDRAAILGGRAGVGVRGSVFWVGENKYGSGMRYGLRGDDGETYWVDESHLGPESSAPAPAAGPKQQPGQPETFERGDRVRITGGKDRGAEGEVFWVGESKYGAGMRYGVRGADGEAFWVDEALVERAGTEPAPQAAAPAPRAAQAPRAAPARPAAQAPRAAPARPAAAPARPAAAARPAAPASSAKQPLPAADEDLPPEAYEHTGEELPPEAYESYGELPPEAYDLPPEAYEHNSDDELPPEAFDDGEDLPY